MSAEASGVSFALRSPGGQPFVSPLNIDQLYVRDA